MLTYIWGFIWLIWYESYIWYHDYESKWTLYEMNKRSPMGIRSSPNEHIYGSIRDCQVQGSPDDQSVPSRLWPSNEPVLWSLLRIVFMVPHLYCWNKVMKESKQHKQQKLRWNEYIPKQVNLLFLLHMKIHIKHMKKGEFPDISKNAKIYTDMTQIKF